MLGSIQSEEKRRTSEGEKNSFTIITTYYTQLWGFWEPTLWESKANINKNTPVLWTTELLPMLYSYMLFTHTYLNLGVQCVVDLLRPPCSTFFFFFFSAAIPQALLNATLTILQSADLQMSRIPASLCVSIQYIPISIVGKLVSISFSETVISAWVGF